MVANNDRTNVNVAGATTEVATLKEAVSKDENSAALERTEREKQEARVGEVQQELQAVMMKHEVLELDSKTRAFELAVAIESVKSAKAESQKTLQELDAVKKITAGKAFFMQSRNIKVNYMLLTRIRSSPGAFADLPHSVPTPPHSTELKRAARRKRCSGLSMLRSSIRCP